MIENAAVLRFTTARDYRADVHAVAPVVTLYPLMAEKSHLPDQFIAPCIRAKYSTTARYGIFQVTRSSPFFGCVIRNGNASSHPSSMSRAIDFASVMK
jgi:hypothetical protein